MYYLLRQAPYAMSLMALYALVGCAPLEREPLGQSTTSTETSPIDEGNESNQPSKRDHSNHIDPISYASCAEDSLMIERKGDEYIATITAPDVVEYFIAESEQTLEARVDYSGESKVITVQKNFPWMVDIVDNQDGSQYLSIRDLKLYDEGERFSTSGPPGTTLTLVDGGYELVINGSAMRNSHRPTYYQVADYYFESCIFDSEIESIVE